MMRSRRIRFLSLTLGLLLLAGCGGLPLSRREGPAAARLTISFHSAAPEDVTIEWEPADMAVDSAELSRPGGVAAEASATIATGRLRPGKSGGGVRTARPSGLPFAWEIDEILCRLPPGRCKRPYVCAALGGGKLLRRAFVPAAL